jgi:hypothetical protein
VFYHNFDIAGRYVAPEVMRNEEYDAKVDVFSFALILQEASVVIVALHISLCFCITHTPRKDLIYFHLKGKRLPNLSQRKL